MFNPDLTIQTQEVIFSRTIVKPFRPQSFINKVPMELSVSKKHLGLHLDQKLDFSKHINEKISKAQKEVSVCKILYILPRNALLTIYKSLVRPHLDYDDIVHDQPDNQSFFNKIEAIQYNAALAVTNAIKVFVDGLGVFTFYKIKT